MSIVRRSCVPLLVLAGLLVAGRAGAECAPTDLNTAEQGYSTAYQFVTAGQWAEAIPSLVEATKACPEHWPSLELLAQAYARTDAFVDAADWYQKLIDGQCAGILARADMRILQGYGYVLLRNRNWPVAEQAYEAILGQDPDNREAHERLVYCYDRSGNRRKAIVHLEALYVMSTGEAQADYATKIGNAYKFLGDNEKAKQWFELGGGAASGMFSIGVENMNKQKWQAAVDAFTAFLEGKSDSAPAWKNLGVSLQRLGRTQEAIDAFKKTLELDAERHDVVSNLGFLYADLDRWTDVAALAKPALDGWPEDDQYKDRMRFLMAKVYEKRDANYEAAIELFRAAQDDPVLGDRAANEITRQRQLIEIRDKKSNSGR